MKTAALEVYGIIPASGFSRRMGSQKLLLPWRNKALLEHVLDTVNRSTLTGAFTVVPSQDMERMRIASNSGSHIVMNPEPVLGIGFSIAVGLQSIPDSADAVMILLGDQPELQLEDIENVLRGFAEIKSVNGQSSKAIVQTRYADHKIGHPILFSREFFTELSRLEGDCGGKEMIQKHLPSVFYADSKNLYPPDIDTMSEYERLLARLK